MPDRANAERCELPKDRMPMLRVNAEPRSTNAHGKVHAGWLMAKMDLAGALDAERVAKGPVTTVAVTLTSGGTSFTRNVNTDASNNWTAAFSPSEPILDGTYAVSAVGSIGTTRGTAATASVVVDQTPPAAPVISPVTGDNIVTADERAAGLVITGTAEPESTIHVTIGTITQVVATDAAGRWATAAFSAAGMPGGATGVVTAVAIDKAQNQSTPTIAGFAQLASASAEHQQPTELGTTLSLDHLVSTHPGETGLAAATTTTTAGSIDSPQLINTLLEQPNSGNLA